MIHIFGDPCSKAHVITSNVLNSYRTYPKIPFMSIITLQRLWFRTKQCLSANLEKEPFIQVDLLGKYSFEDWAEARLQLHSTLSRYPGAVNKLHQPPNVWALHAPFSENVLQAITPPASIWPDFWEVAPAASQMAVSLWISLVTSQSLIPSFTATERRCLSAWRTDPSPLTQVTKLANLLFWPKKHKCHRNQNALGQHTEYFLSLVKLCGKASYNQKQGTPSNESKPNGIKSRWPDVCSWQ